MRILNWNSQWLGPRSHKGRFAKATALIAGYDPDVICLSEARAELMPSSGHTITSDLSGSGAIEIRGARKVVLWSRFGWSDVNTLGSPCLPEGRFVSARTAINDEEWTIIGMCIPYHAYRIGEKWAEKTMSVWQGACQILDALREDFLPQLHKQQRTILAGDFNLQIPPAGYPGKNSEVNQKRKQTFAGWLIPTSGIQRRFIDHVAMSADLRLETMQFISKVAPDGAALSDHNGVCLDIVPDTH